MMRTGYVIRIDARTDAAPPPEPEKEMVRVRYSWMNIFQLDTEAEVVEAECECSLADSIGYISSTPAQNPQ
jgi:hypothetical protein